MQLKRLQTNWTHVAALHHVHLLALVFEDFKAGKSLSNASYMAISFRFVPARWKRLCSASSTALSNVVGLITVRYSFSSLGSPLMKELIRTASKADVGIVSVPGVRFRCMVTRAA